MNFKYVDENDCDAVMSYYPCIFKKTMRKAMIECQDRWCCSRDSNRASSEYKSDLLRPGPTFSILGIKKMKYLEDCITR
jgi:hypothetical protein